jgi:hypothetical protein
MLGACSGASGSGPILQVEIGGSQSAASDVTLSAAAAAASPVSSTTASHRFASRMDPASSALPGSTPSLPPLGTAAARAVPGRGGPAR